MPSLLFAGLVTRPRCGHPTEGDNARRHHSAVHQSRNNGHRSRIAVHSREGFHKRGTLPFRENPTARQRTIQATSIITTVAGTGATGYTGDQGPAASAQLAGPSGLASDSDGNAYVADQFNNVVRMLEPVSAEGRKRRNPRGMVRMRSRRGKPCPDGSTIRKLTAPELGT